MLLLAVDYLTLDIVSWSVEYRETVYGYVKLIDSVEACGYHIGALVSDGHTAITSLTRETKPSFRHKYSRTYPRPGITPAQIKRPRLYGVPHQLCLTHAQRELETLVSKLPKKDQRLLTSHCRRVLFAKNLKQAQKRQSEFASLSVLLPVSHQSACMWIFDHWETLTTHHWVRVNRGKIPRTSNTVENIISYLTARLKTVKRLRSLKSAVNITNLIVMNYRFKPLENTKNKLKKGKTPLELVIGQKLTLDWTDFIHKSTA